MKKNVKKTPSVKITLILHPVNLSELDCVDLDLLKICDDFVMSKVFPHFSTEGVDICALFSQFKNRPDDPDSL